MKKCQADESILSLWQKEERYLTSLIWFARRSRRIWEPWRIQELPRLSKDKMELFLSINLSNPEYLSKEFKDDIWNLLLDTGSEFQIQTY